MKKLAPKTKEDYLREIKYHAFRKTDAHLMGIKSWIICYLFSPFCIPRIVIGWGSAFIGGFIIFVLTIGYDRNKGEYTEFQKRFISILTSITGRVVAWTCSGVYLEEKRPNICYEKYLGPDWKPSYENPGSIISNHSSWVDILVHMYR